MSQPIFTMTGHEVFINNDTGARISIYIEVKGRHEDELSMRASKRAERQIRAVFGGEMLDISVLQSDGDGVVDREFYSPTFERIDRHDQVRMTPNQRHSAVDRLAYLPESEQEAEQIYGPSVAAPAAKILARLGWRLPQIDDRAAVWDEINEAEKTLQAAAKKYRAKEARMRTISPIEKREQEMDRLIQLREEISVGVWSVARARERMLQLLSPEAA